MDKNFLQHWNLTGKRAFVSGASQGIGLSSAVALSQLGATVIAVARDASKLKILAGKLYGQDHVLFAADLDTASGRELMNQAFGEYGYPHIVVANLHIRHKNVTLTKGATSGIARMIESNLNYLADMLPQSLELQRRENFGRWIGVSSMAAVMGGPGQAGYGACKQSLESIFKALAIEEGKSNITANIVAPGIIDTPGVRDHYSAELLEGLSGMNVIGRAGTPEEVAHAIAFLASPSASFITGVTLPVAGGYDLGWGIKNLLELRKSL